MGRKTPVSSVYAVMCLPRTLWPLGGEYTYLQAFLGYQVKREYAEEEICCLHNR